MYYNHLYELPARYRRAIINAVEVVQSTDVPGLQKIILFGSCARLNILATSDVDIAIVTEELLTSRALTGGLRCDIEDLGERVTGDIVFLHTARYDAVDCKLIENIRRDGIVLWEGGDYADDYKQLLCSSS